MTDAIIRAAIAVAEREERHAHAEFYHGKAAGQSREDSDTPWRGWIDPRHRHLIAELEKAGHYQAPEFTDA